MNKEQFVNCIDSIKKQMEYDTQSSIKIGEVFSDAFTANLRYNNDFVIDALFDVLTIIFGDSGGWIGYFVYELEFGKKWDETRVTIEEYGVKNFIKLETSSDLFDLLIKSKEK